MVGLTDQLDMVLIVLTEPLTKLTKQCFFFFFSISYKIACAPSKESDQPAHAQSDQSLRRAL